MELQAGRLLIASPLLADPNFARTIVLLLDAGEDGALGVVLNRRSDIQVADVLDGWSGLVSNPQVLFSGGPVETQAALAVAMLREGTELPGWRSVGGGLGLIDLDTPTEVIADALLSVRIYAGYAGWGAGQLEAEIAEGSWYLASADPTDPFADPSRLWGQVLRRQGGELALLSTLPKDVALN